MSLLSEICCLVENYKSDGVYIGIRYENTVEVLKDFFEELKKRGVKNVIPFEKIHTTLIYSSKNPDSEIKIGEDLLGVKVKFSKFHIFDSADGKKVLVLKLNSNALVDKHKKLMKDHNLSYDYDEYIPHITVSYDIGDLDLNIIKGIKLPKELSIKEVYVNRIIKSWQSNG